MSLISASERSIYLPDLADLSWAEISSLLFRAEAIAEGPQGANRKFQITKHTETREISGKGIFRLKYTPVVPDSFPTVLKVRGNSNVDGFSRTSPGTEWIEVEPDAYEIDTDTSEVRLLRLPAFLNEGRIGSMPGMSGLSGHRRLPPASPVRRSQIKITYAAGIDFNATPLSDDALTIKRAIAGMVSVMGTSSNQGMSSFELKNFYKVDYDSGRSVAAITSSKASSVVDELLMVLRRFRPREVFI